MKERKGETQAHLGRLIGQLVLTQLEVFEILVLVCMVPYGSKYELQSMHNAMGAETEIVESRTRGVLVVQTAIGVRDLGLFLSSGRLREVGFLVIRRRYQIPFRSADRQEAAPGAEEIAEVRQGRRWWGARVRVDFGSGVLERQ
jgi:hypothetical protein